MNLKNKLFELTQEHAPLFDDRYPADVSHIQFEQERPSSMNPNIYLTPVSNNKEASIDALEVALSLGPEQVTKDVYTDLAEKGHPSTFVPINKFLLSQNFSSEGVSIRPDSTLYVRYSLDIDNQATLVKTLSDLNIYIQDHYVLND